MITSFGCQLTDSISLNSDIQSSILIPNAFSPNNDGINDFWYVTVTEDETTIIESITIYNRWGNRVYFSDQVIINNPQEGWDGTFKNEKLNPGVYVYHVVYADEEGQRRNLTGDLTIIN